MLAWYDANRRDLPWRNSRDPYAIWLSEVMLQQTTVRTVEPRWRRFLERWPTLADLAAAPLDDVLHEWTGLGYYARARNLHRAAVAVAADFGGRMPARYELLLALPGMGPYTAAAVASIAFGEAVAVVDANVERVLARLLAIEDDIKAARARAALRGAAGELLSDLRPGDFNQAMMELGATICLPRVPRCGECPVAELCRARAAGMETAYPRMAPKAPMEDAREAAIVLTRGEKILLLRRPAGASFGGMWEVPRVRCVQGESSEEAALRAVAELTGLAAPADPPRLILRLRHTVMRSRIELRVFQSPAPAGRPKATKHEELKWATAGEWLDLPKSTTMADVAKLLAGWRPSPPA